MPPSVAKTSTGTSPAEPVDDPKFVTFEVVSSSHNVAGEDNQSNSRYKAQCAAIGGDIGGEDSDFFGMKFCGLVMILVCRGEQPKIIISPMTTAGPARRNLFHPSF